MENISKNISEANFGFQKKLFRLPTNKTLSELRWKIQEPLLVDTCATPAGRTTKLKMAGTCVNV